MKKIKKILFEIISSIQTFSDFLIFDFLGTPQKFKFDFWKFFGFLIVVPVILCPSHFKFLKNNDCEKRYDDSSEACFKRQATTFFAVTEL